PRGGAGPPLPRGDRWASWRRSRGRRAWSYLSKALNACRSRGITYTTRNGYVIRETNTVAPCVTPGRKYGQAHSERGPQRRRSREGVRQGAQDLSLQAGGGLPAFTHRHFPRWRPGGQEAP